MKRNFYFANPWSYENYFSIFTFHMTICNSDEMLFFANFHRNMKSVKWKALVKCSPDLLSLRYFHFCSANLESSWMFLCPILFSSPLYVSYYLFCCDVKRILWYNNGRGGRVYRMVAVYIEPRLSSLFLFNFFFLFLRDTRSQ